MYNHGRLEWFRNSQVPSLTLSIKCQCRDGK